MLFCNASLSRQLPVTRFGLSLWRCAASETLYCLDVNSTPLFWESLSVWTGGHRWGTNNPFQSNLTGQYTCMENACCSPFQTTEKLEINRETFFILLPAKGASPTAIYHLQMVLCHTTVLPNNKTNAKECFLFVIWKNNLTIWLWMKCTARLKN